MQTREQQAGNLFLILMGIALWVIVLTSCTTSKVVTYKNKKSFTADQRWNKRHQHKHQHCAVLSNVSSQPR